MGRAGWRRGAGHRGHPGRYAGTLTYTQELLRAVSVWAQRRVRQKPRCWKLWGQNRSGRQSLPQQEFCAAGSRGTLLGFFVSGILLVLVLQNSPAKWT